MNKKDGDCENYRRDCGKRNDIPDRPTGRLFHWWYCAESHLLHLLLLYFYHPPNSAGEMQVWASRNLLLPKLQQK